MIFITTGSLNTAEKSKLFFIVLVMIFLLVDFQNSSGFVQCVIYPPCREICLAVWELLYVVILIMFMPFKCVYKLVVEILIYELHDICIFLLSMPVNIWKILCKVPLVFFQGVKSFICFNSWAGLLHRTIHIIFIILFRDSTLIKDLIKFFEIKELINKTKKKVLAVRKRLRKRNE